MNHARHTIREAIVAALAAGGTTAGTRVFDNPADPRTTFPALVVTDDGEDQQAVSVFGGMANRRIERTLHLVISAEVQQIANYARARDQLLASVESILAGSAIAGVKVITPAGFLPDQDVQGERPIVVGRQRFDVTYITPQGDPSTTL